MNTQRVHILPDNLTHRIMPWKLLNCSGEQPFPPVGQSLMGYSRAGRHTSRASFGPRTDLSPVALRPLEGVHSQFCLLEAAAAPESVGFERQYRHQRQGDMIKSHTGRKLLSCCLLLQKLAQDGNLYSETKTFARRLHSPS